MQCLAHSQTKQNQKKKKKGTVGTKNTPHLQQLRLGLSDLKKKRKSMAEVTVLWCRKTR